MQDIDVTDSVEVGGIDGELMPLEKCVCGKQFDYWDFILKNERDRTNDCPACGRRLYFSVKVSVFEVRDAT